MDDRAFRIFFARVMLNECRARRHRRVNRDFYWSLFASAQKARRLAASMRATPVQGGLFS